jgi:subtilisin family serine protease
MFRMFLVLCFTATLLITVCSLALGKAVKQDIQDAARQTILCEKATGEHPTPNDLFFDKQHYFEKMRVLEAWSITKGNPDCLIGVIEMGIKLDHPDLQRNLLDGYVSRGMEHPNTRFHLTHGTAITGLIAAEADNGIGIAGLAPNCRVIPAQVGTQTLLRSKRTRESARKWNRLVGEKFAEAICYLVDRDCKVINCSFTAATTPRTAFEYAIEHDVVVVMASGNFNSERPNFPAGVLDVLCVGSVGRDDKRWVQKPIEIDPIEGRKRKVTQGSNYGEGLSIVAPVYDLVVCVKDLETIELSNTKWTSIGTGEYVKGYMLDKKGRGTSYAAPMASALVGLIRSLRPDLDHRTVITIVEQGADDLGEKGWDKYTGWGRLNFYKSLRLAQSWPKVKCR